MNSEAASVSAVINLLTKEPAVISCNFPPGQIILYKNHVPNGIFVVLKGSLCVCPEEFLRFNSRRRKSRKLLPDGDLEVAYASKSSPLIIPSLRSLEIVALNTLMVVDPVEALFISRSSLVRPIIHKTLSSLSA